MRDWEGACHGEGHTRGRGRPLGLRLPQSGMHLLQPVRRRQPARRRAERQEQAPAALLVASRFMLDLAVGDRNALTADFFVAGVAARLRRLPLFVVDNWKTYRGAFLRIAHRVVHRRRKSRSQRGRRPGPRLAPRSDLLVAVVNKVRDATGNLVKVTRFVLYGTRRAVKAAIRATGAGKKIATAYLERPHATMRSQTARMIRRTRAGSMLAELLGKQLLLWRDAYNWVRVHGSLDGRTPAMAAGLTDHVWTMSEYVMHPVHRSPYEDMERAERVKGLLECPLDPRKEAAAQPMSRRATQFLPPREC